MKRPDPIALFTSAVIIITISNRSLFSQHLVPPVVSRSSTLENVLISFVAPALFILVSVYAAIKLTQLVNKHQRNTNTDPGSRSDELRIARTQEPALTVGMRVGPTESLPAVTRRAGKCPTCGTVWPLESARRECLDWEEVDAYHYYCPKCFRGTGPNYNRGLLRGSDGNPMIDQQDWRRG